MDGACDGKFEGRLEGIAEGLGLNDGMRLTKGDAEGSGVLGIDEGDTVGI